MGSQTFRSMAAEMTPSGALRVLGVEESSQKRCVHHGQIENTGDAGYMLNSIIKLLGNRIRKENLDSVFVCVGGKSMKVAPVCSKRDLVHNRFIDAELLYKMEMECREKIERNYPDWMVSDLIPSYYVLDGKEQEDAPTPDQAAVFIEAHFTAVVGNVVLVDKLDKTFQQTTLSMEHMYARPEALMNVLSTEEEMQEGCAVLDLGAQTTTLTIHKGGEYLYSHVVPIGGYDITEAIEQLGLSLLQAERLKCMYGVATKSAQTNRQYVLTNAAGGKVGIGSQQLSAVITAKLDEMLAPLMEQLNKEAHRLKVLYVTGGGVMLQGVVDYIQTKTSVKVMYGSHAGWLTTDTPDEYCMPQYASLVGTLLLAANYRQTHPVKPAKSKNRPIIDKIKEMNLDLFTPDNF